MQTPNPPLTTVSRFETSVTVPLTTFACMASDSKLSPIHFLTAMELRSTSQRAEADEPDAASSHLASGGPQRFASERSVKQVALGCDLQNFRVRIAGIEREKPMGHWGIYIAYAWMATILWAFTDAVQAIQKRPPLRPQPAEPYTRN